MSEEQIVRIQLRIRQSTEPVVHQFLSQIPESQRSSVIRGIIYNFACNSWGLTPSLPGELTARNEIVRNIVKIGSAPAAVASAPPSPRPAEVHQVPAPPKAEAEPARPAADVKLGPDTNDPNSPETSLMESKFSAGFMSSGDKPKNDEQSS